MRITVASTRSPFEPSTDASEMGVPDCAPGEYLIHMAAWIIQDGNYGDFRVGEQREFALEISPLQPLQASSGAHQVAQSGTAYHISGDAAWWDRSHAVAITFGISAYMATNTGSVPRSGTLKGLVSLGIDPFDYFERLARLRGAPPLIYDWHLRGLYLQAAPWVERRPRYHVRDVRKLAWTPIDATDALSDDDGNADYLIRARPMGPPRHRLDSGTP